MDDTRITIKVPPEVHRLLRLVAAETRETHPQILGRLLTKEWERLQARNLPKELAHDP